MTSCSASPIPAPTEASTPAPARGDKPDLSRKEAVIDALTGLRNRCGLLQDLAEREGALQDAAERDPTAGTLPAAVRAVAGRALRTAEHPDSPAGVALARVLSRSGTWIVLHRASLIPDGRRRVPVIVEPAHPASAVSWALAQLEARSRGGQP